MGSVLKRSARKEILKSCVNSKALNQKRCVNSVFEYFCFILDHGDEISPEGKSKRVQKKYIRTRQKFTIDAYDFSYLAYSQKEFDEHKQHEKYGDKVLLCNKVKPYESTGVTGSRNLDVFWGRGNAGTLLVRDRFCCCNSCFEIVTNNNLNIYKDGVLLKCKYISETGDWKQRSVKLKTRAGRRKTRSATEAEAEPDNNAAVQNIEAVNKFYRENRLKKDSFQFSCLPDNEYTSLSNKFRPQQMEQIATYDICKVIKEPFKITVSKGKNINVTRRINIKSTVKKGSYVVIVAWAKVLGNSFAARNKLQFQIDPEDLAIVECGDSIEWSLGQSEEPIRVKKLDRYNRNTEVFELDQDVHQMLQTMDGKSS
jgi:hypothetical protein